MKRYISCNYTPGWAKQGFLLTMNKHTLVLISDSRNLTEKVIRKLINKVCNLKGVSDSIRQAALYDEDTLDDFRRRIDKVSVIQKTFDNGNKWYTIAANNFQFNYPSEEEFNQEVIMFE